MTTDAKTIRLVIGVLGLIALGMLALIGIIAVNDTPGEVPEALWGAFSFVAGGLVGMLARTSAAPDPVAPPVTTGAGISTTPPLEFGSFPGKP